MKSFYSAKIWIKYRGFLFFLLFSLLPFVISFFLSVFISDKKIIITIAVYGCSLALFGVLQSVRAMHFDFLRKNDWTVALVSIAVGVAAYIIAMLLTVGVVSIFTVVFRDSLPAWITASNQGFVSFLDSDNALIRSVWFIIIAAIAPMTEEIIFRGYLQDSMAQLCHHKIPHLTIVTTAFIFALFHTNSLANMIFAFTVGMALSFLRQRHGSLIPSVIAHGTVNAVSLLIGLIAA